MTTSEPITPDCANPFLDAVRGGRKPALGVWSMLNSANAIEALAWHGYDWLLIDGEHAPIELSDVESALRILDPSPTAPMVRIAGHDPQVIKRYLDVGVRSLMVPFVDTAQQASEIAQSMRYPPDGRRGVALLHRASRFGAVGDYIGKANETMCLIAQIESMTAMANVAEIASVDGVDAVFFGPGDLSAAMGLPGQAGSPEVTQAIIGKLPDVRRSGKLAGALGATPEQADAFVDAGFDFVSVGNDIAFLLSASRDRIGRFTRSGD